MRKALLAVVGCTVAIIATGLLVVGRAIPAPVPQPPQSSTPRAAQSQGPTIIWSLPQLTQTLFPGAPSTASASFRSDQALGTISIWTTPSLDGIVSVSPATLPSIKANQDYTLTFTLIAPPAFQKRSFGGTVHIRNAGTPPRTYGTPLTVNLHTDWNAVLDTSIGLSMTYPADWLMQKSLYSTTFSNVQQPSSLTLEDIAFFEVRYMPQANPSGLPINQWFAHFSQNLPAPPLSVDSLSIDNHAAVSAALPEIGSDTAIYLSRGTDIIEITYNTAATRFVADYQAMLSSLTFIR